MADIAISSLGALAAADLEPDDELPIVDVHDLTQSPAGSTKKIAVKSLFTDATFAGTTTVDDLAVTDDATIDGDLDVNGDVAAASISGDGAGLTNLDADELDDGTVPTPRLAGSYTGIVGTGALDAGSITTGFGSIDVGTDPISCGTASSRRLLGTGTTPGLSNTPASATAVSITGTDTKGIVAFTTGAGVSINARIATITFTTAFSATPAVVVIPNQSFGGTPTLYLQAVGTASFDVHTGANIASPIVCGFHYHVIG